MIAVMMMAHGTPERLDQMEEYLTRVRGGRRPPPGLAEEMMHNYAAIGGRSPLTELTLSQARALEAELGASFRVFVGMRNWRPYIKDVVPKAIEAGAERIVGLPMTPQYASLSFGKYADALREALPAGFPLVLVRPWYDHPGVVGAFAENIEKALVRSGPFDRLVFTAHSLPERVSEEGEPPYPRQVEATARAVAERLGFRHWQVAYQSAGRTPEPWLGPDLPDVISELARQGCRRVLVAPVGFVCDHTEILFDIDIQTKQAAQELGVDLVRSASLNASPTFIRALADIVRSQLKL